MEVTHIYAKLSSAKRQQVGCIIVKDDRVISIGYNGTPSGWDNVCEDRHGKTKPEVYHAEENAIGKLAGCTESGKGATAFVTLAPCIECAKLLARAGIKEVYYNDNSVTSKGDGIPLLEKSGIAVHRYKLKKVRKNNDNR